MREVWGSDPEALAERRGKEGTRAVLKEIWGSNPEIRAERRETEGTGTVDREVWGSNPDETRSERRRVKEGIAAAERGSGVKPRDTSGIWEVKERV